MQHEMKIIDPKEGDKHIEWDPSDPASVTKARDTFNEYRGKNYRTYKVSRKPQRTGAEVTEFDPNAGEYIIAPALAGG